MSLIRYRPLPMTTLQDQINRMFDEFDRQFLDERENLGGGTFAPAMDVKENAETYTVHVEVPGLKQDHLDLSLQDNVLTVRGIKEHKSQAMQGEYRRVERSYGRFARSVTLPRPVDGSQVTADLEHGVLTVVLPKLDVAKPRQIAIGVNGSQPAFGSQAALSGKTVTVEAEPVRSGAEPIKPAPDESTTGGGTTGGNTTGGSAADDMDEASRQPAPTNPAEANPDNPEPTGTPEGTPS